MIKKTVVTAVALAFGVGGAVTVMAPAQASSSIPMTVTDRSDDPPNGGAGPVEADLEAGDPQDFWDGTGSFRINNYGETSSSGRHRSLYGTVGVTGSCPDGQVHIEAAAVFENLGPGSGVWYTGGFNVISADGVTTYPGATGTTIDSRYGGGAGVGDHDVSLSVTVPLSEVQAENVVLQATVEVGHNAQLKDWLLKEFTSTATLLCPPDAADDTVVGVGTGPFEVSPLDNDTAETATTDTPATLTTSSLRVWDGDSWETSATIAGQGTWTVDTATGTVQFTPEEGFTGDATIEYQVSNSDGVSSTADMTVTIPGEGADDEVIAPPRNGDHLRSAG
ncbi:MAG: cadherin-like domain-containing protein [Aeromicrobium sp.]|uniref:Ig-like domain-containing protein n=1 Tax=Aeromicrobium sp. TaxID=1871063 RepID=UPI0039E22A3C